MFGLSLTISIVVQKSESSESSSTLLTSLSLSLSIPEFSITCSCCDCCLWSGARSLADFTALPSLSVAKLGLVTSWRLWAALGANLSERMVCTFLFELNFSIFMVSASFGTTSWDVILPWLTFRFHSLNSASGVAGPCFKYL